MTLEDRIVRLERQNRWMKRIGGVAVALVGLLLTVGQSKPQDTTIQARNFIAQDIIQARHFIVVDEKGERRGSFGIPSKDGPALVLYEKGAIRTFLTLGTLNFKDEENELSLSSEPSITLRDKEHGHIMISIDPPAAATGGGPAINLGSKSGGVEIHVSPTKGSQVMLGAGVPPSAGSVLSVNKDGAVFFLKAKAGLITMATDPKLGPSLTIFDSAEKAVFDAP